MVSLSVFSDLHLEHSAIELNTSSADVVVLAGDIFALGQAFVDDYSVITWAHEKFPNKPVVFVPGNHDFEDSCWERQMNVWKQQAKEMGEHIHVLWDESVDLFGVRFLGTPLFSNFASTGNVSLCKEEALVIPDFKRIHHLNGQCVHPNDYETWHRKSCLWLNEELSKDDGVPKIVVSHFAPSPLLRSPSRQHQVLDAYWVNNCEDLVEKANLWISGHTHYSCDIACGDGRMISNARGTSKTFNLSSDSNFQPNHLFHFSVPTNKIRFK